VILGDSPGPGGKRRTLIVFELDDYISWHGNAEALNDEA
jgi:hypothetical protein